MQQVYFSTVILTTVTFSKVIAKLHYCGLCHWCLLSLLIFNEQKKFLRFTNDLTYMMSSLWFEPPLSVHVQSLLYWSGVISFFIRLSAKSDFIDDVPTQVASQAVYRSLPYNVSSWQLTRQCITNTSFLCQVILW